MTIADFQRHLTNQNCAYEPVTGVNVTGFALKITNKQNQRRYFLSIYQGGELSDKTIITACDALLIKYPPHLSHLAIGWQES